MAGTSLLTLIDDIASILDDVALMTKMAAKKTMGVVGDDLALNANQVNGIQAERELPVVWAVAKGSMKNKAIIVPVAILISAVAPYLITPILMLGGLYLCFEGVEKLVHKYLHRKQSPEKKLVKSAKVLSDPEVDVVELEKGKIKGAIRTDFILSAEIIVIVLGTVQDAVFLKQVIVLIAMAILMTVGVYGLVAGIVKLDDAGLYLSRTENERGWGKFKKILGKYILNVAPYLMKTLTVAGTIAMFMVGGGIIVHGFHSVGEILHHAEKSIETVPIIGSILASITPTIGSILMGIISGIIALGCVNIATSVYKSFKKEKSQPETKNKKRNTIPKKRKKKKGGK